MIKKEIKRENYQLDKELKDLKHKIDNFNKDLTGLNKAEVKILEEIFFKSILLLKLKEKRDLNK